MERERLRTKKNRMPVIAVIGGGASGLFAAITAAEALRAAGVSAQVRVYDANEQPARKILVSGNGRCNLSNTALSAEMYPGCEQRLLQEVFKQFSNRDLLGFFLARGLYTKTDVAGRVYPRSNQAATVRDFLLYLCAQAGVEIFAGCPITSLKKNDGAFLLNGQIRADRVILACGSPAAPRNGGRDSLSLARAVGAHTVPFSPALTCLMIRGFSKNQLKGLRADGEIAVVCSGRVLAKDRGEIQYAEYGLSGIPALQVSAAAGRKLCENEEVFVRIDSMPELSEEAFAATLRDVCSNKGETPAAVFLDGMFPKRLSAFFLKRCGIAPEAKAAALSPAVQRELCAAVKRISFPISAVGGFADAQAARGGVPASELDHSTLELKTCSCCYVCGEFADVAGVCGGYNLQWAWSSGFVAGSSAARGLIY